MFLPFDQSYNQSLEKVSLPSTLWILTFGDDFNLSLERVSLISTLQILAFGYFFRQSLEKVWFQGSLQILRFASEFRFKMLSERLSLPAGCSVHYRTVSSDSVVCHAMFEEEYLFCDGHDVAVAERPVL